jgi:hypothetical protein
MVTAKTNGHATGRDKLSARGLIHQRLSKSQLAAKLAGVLEGDTDLEPTARQLAEWFGVNEGYIRVARAMSPEKRKAVASGKDATSFGALLNPFKQLALPAPKSIDDSTLVDIVRTAGIDRVLAAAVSVENGHNGHAS